jgi:hypothetical protein
VGRLQEPFRSPVLAATLLPNPFSYGFLDGVSNGLSSWSCGGELDGDRRVSLHAWLWTRHTSGRTGELANFSVNLGNGIALLTLTGSMQPVGKVTPQSGHAITTETRKTRPGTGVYKALTGTGTYTFEIKRTATRYTLLKLTLRGHLN